MNTEDSFLDRIQPQYILHKDNLEYTKNILKVLLGIEYALYVKTQNYHWNVTGVSFASLHKLFEEQYKASAEFIDRIAEQIRKYGLVAPGSMSEFLILNNNVINETMGGLWGQAKMISDLMLSNEIIVQYINSLTIDNFDLAIQNLLGDLLDFHMKNSWMLRAHLE